MESGEILDSQISASSEYDIRHSAQNGRLNFEDPDKANAWAPRTSSGSWLQVDFKILAIITEVLTQGRREYSQWVKSFTLSYTNNSNEFVEYVQNGGKKVISISIYLCTSDHVYYIAHCVACCTTTAPRIALHALARAFRVH
jgi:hypothetical protein